MKSQSKQLDAFERILYSRMTFLIEDLFYKVYHALKLGEKHTVQKRSHAIIANLNLDKETHYEKNLKKII